jgi:hypothetical protein
MTAALIPATLIQFHLDPQTLWQLSAASFLLLLWVGGTCVVVFDTEYRQWFREHFRRAPLFAIMFWVGLEVPIQVSLFLALFNVVPEWSEGFVVTALMFNLFQAATLLTRFLFEKPAA